MIKCVCVVSVLLMSAAALPDLVAATDNKLDEAAGVEEPFLIRVRAGGDERGIERFQRILVISLPFCAVYSYGLCYFSAAAEQRDKTPNLYQPRDYKPFILGGAVGLSFAVAIYDYWWRRKDKASKASAETISRYRRVGVSTDRQNISEVYIELAGINF